MDSRVFDGDLAEIERVSVGLEGVLGRIAGTRSTFCVPADGPRVHRVTRNRRTIARYGLTVCNANDVIDAAVGEMAVSTVITGRFPHPSIARRRWERILEGDPNGG